MNRHWLLRSSLWVPQPPEAVFPFFADARNLQALTPPWLQFRILTPAPIAMQRGTVIDLALRIRGLPVRWRTGITWYAPPLGFADEQLRGPYRRWVHLHTFLPRDGGTELADRVVLTPPGGPFAPLVFRCLVRGEVLRVFDYRLRVIAERFGGDLGTGCVWFEATDAAPDLMTGASAPGRFTC